METQARASHLREHSLTWALCKPQTLIHQAWVGVCLPNKLPEASGPQVTVEKRTSNWNIRPRSVVKPGPTFPPLSPEALHLEASVSQGDLSVFALP